MQDLLHRRPHRLELGQDNTHHAHQGERVQARAPRVQGERVQAGAPRVQAERVQARVPRVHAERDETKNPPTFDTIICICFLHLPELKIEKEFLR